jgi:transposase
MTMMDIAEFLKISWDGVKDIIKRRLVERFSQPDITNLKYLAIDEISVRKGHKYVTLVMNLETGAVIFVGDGKGADALIPFWKRLGKSRCRKIKAVATDLSPAYIGAVIENLPKAKLVFDHFHVVKLMNEHITSIRRNLYHEITDVLQKQALKGARWILLKNPENLNEKYDEKQRLEEALRLNEPLATAYYMKEDLRQIWSQPDQQTAAAILDGWIKTAMNSGLAPLVKMGNTLQTHRYGILNWYDHPISSGPMEGTNNKIKTLKRQAYGFRDLEFFKLRILAIHEARYAFTG